MAIQMRVSYREPTDDEWQEPWLTCPYDRPKAERLVPVLKKMGCVDVKLVPAKERVQKKLDKSK